MLESVDATQNWLIEVGLLRTRLVGDAQMRRPKRLVECGDQFHWRRQRCRFRNCKCTVKSRPTTTCANGAGSEIVNAQSRAAPCKCTVKSRPPYHFQPRPRGHWAGPPHALYEQYGCRPSHGATLASSVMGGAAPAVSPCSGTADLAIDSVSVLSAGGVMRPTASPIGVIRVT